MTARHRILLLAFSILFYVLGIAQLNTLRLERRGNSLQATAPRLHFISGKAAEKLQNGSTIIYVLTLTVIPQHTRSRPFQLQDRFAVSYDLWEEKYSVIQRAREARSASRLSATAAETWCLENMPIPVHATPDRQPFTVKLECSIEEAEENKNGENNSQLTLAGLIEVFSRKEKDEPPRWEALGGPFLLADIKNTEQDR